MTKSILVTGITGRTGRLVFQQLRQRPEQFESFGLARSKAKAKDCFGNIDGCYFGDIADPASLTEAMAGRDAVIIVTSAVPRLKAPPQPGQRPEFDFPPGEMPEQIDYIGQKNQIDAAVQAGVKHIVLMGSMGGTQVDHPLNRLGNGQILIWKRQAEQYLIDSGIDYTLVRAGGLSDQPGGLRELVVGKHDALQILNDQGRPVAIPRADVATVLIQALQAPGSRNKAFDLMAKAGDDPTAVITTDFAALFAQTTPGL